MEKVSITGFRKQRKEGKKQVLLKGQKMHQSVLTGSPTELGHKIDSFF